MADLAHDLVAVHDLHGKIESVTPSVEAFLGYRPEELVGRDAAGMVDPRDRHRIRVLFGGVIRRGPRRLSARKNAPAVRYIAGERILDLSDAAGEPPTG